MLIVEATGASGVQGCEFPEARLGYLWDIVRDLACLRFREW
jgi:hypothetical protein